MGGLFKKDRPPNYPPITIFKKYIWGFERIGSSRNSSNTLATGNWISNFSSKSTSLIPNVCHAAARRARPDFRLKNEQQHVLRLCRLVDGIPLAIELAASWLKVLPCAQITQELEHSLELLSTTAHNTPERHRSMQAILENSWALLTKEEQRVFCQLSFFVGGFRYEAAQKVAEASLPVLARLVEKSVVQVRQDGRYRIHAMLRQFGREKLAESSEALPLLQTRHCEYYLSFLADRNQSIAGRNQTRVLEEVDEEFDNIRVAWRFAAQDGQFRQMGHALHCLFRYLWTQGRFNDGESLMAGVLENENLSSRKSVRIVLFRLGSRFVGRNLWLQSENAKKRCC